MSQDVFVSLAGPEAGTGINWAEVIVGVPSVLVALAVAWVVYRQLLLQREQVRIERHRVGMELYESRIKVYNGVKQIFAKAVQQGGLEQDDIWRLNAETREARFLFGGDVSEQIDKIFTESLGLMIGTEEYKSMAVGPERTAAVQAHAAKFQKFLDQNKEIEKLFHPYLAVGDRIFLDD